jgi:hypothetical protein
LDADEIPLVDSFVFAGPFATPATVELDVRWEATGPAAEVGSGNLVTPTDAAAFSGRFAPARATASFEGIELGFSFEGEATTDAGYAQIGTEVNGSFL